MATVRKRGNRWSVQVRRKGYPAEYRTFESKTEAEVWARQRDSRVDRGDQPVDHRRLRQVTLGDVLSRYRDEVTPTKRGREAECLRLNKMLRAPIAAVRLADLQASVVAAYRDSRLATASPATVIKELGLIRRALTIAGREWGLVLTTNPVEKVAKPRAAEARTRRLEAGDWDRLTKALASVRNGIMQHLVEFAIHTGMRRGEMLALQWVDIDADHRVAHLRQTKNGRDRTVPLTDDALATLSRLAATDVRPFPISADAVRQSWFRLRDRAGLPGLRFHDLRHEAISRFAEMGLTTVELAVISGHRDPRMLFRYAHLRPRDLAAKLVGRAWLPNTPPPPAV